MVPALQTLKHTLPDVKTQCTHGDRGKCSFLQSACIWGGELVHSYLALFVLLPGESEDLLFCQTYYVQLHHLGMPEMVLWSPGTVQLLKSDKIKFALNLVCPNVCYTPCCSKAASHHLEEVIPPIPLLHTSMACVRMNGISKPAPSSGYILPKLNHWKQSFKI